MSSGCYGMVSHENQYKQQKVFMTKVLFCLMDIYLGKGGLGQEIILVGETFVNIKKFSLENVLSFFDL